MTPEEFLAAVGKNFIVEEKGEDIYKPSELHNFSLYLNGKWYSLTAKPVLIMITTPLEYWM